MTGYNLPNTDICNINEACSNIAEFRTIFKAELETETTCPSKVANDKMANTLMTDKIADAHVNSAKGKHQISCTKYRFDKENQDDSDLIDGLPKYVRFLESEPFYDEELNSGLNTIETCTTWFSL